MNAVYSAGGVAALVAGCFLLIGAYLDRRAKQPQLESEDGREAGNFWLGQFNALRDENHRLEGRIDELEGRLTQLTDNHKREREEWATSLGLKEVEIQRQQREEARLTERIQRQEQEIVALQAEVTRLRDKAPRS